MSRLKLWRTICEKLDLHSREKAMNALQERGLISDNCVTSEEVADCDLETAIKEL